MYTKIKYCIEITGQGGEPIGLYGPYESDEKAIQNLSEKRWEWRKYKGKYTFLKVIKPEEPPMTALILPIEEENLP